MEDPTHATLGLSVKRQIALDATNPHHFVEFQAPFARGEDRRGWER